MNIVNCGIDLAKDVFHVFGEDGEGKTFSKKLSRSKFLEYFSNRKVGRIGMEACGGAHYWSRELSRLGCEVKMMSPQYVKPFVRGNKNDCNDAQAIFDAMSRPGMRFVSPKTVEQQDVQSAHRVREMKMKHRTGLINQIRGLLSEYGIVMPKGVHLFRKEVTAVVETDPKLSEMARVLLRGLCEDLTKEETRIKEIERVLKGLFKASEACQKIGALPGIGYLTATYLVSFIGDPTTYKNGRAVSAHLGIVPKQHSTGGKEVLLGISKQGDKYLRTLLVHGARAVLFHAGKKEDKDSRWLLSLKERRGQNKACVAQANKTVRRAWAVLMGHEPREAA